MQRSFLGMLRRTAIGLVFLFATLTGCTSVKVPDGGTVFDAGPFTITLPKGMHHRAAQGDDSYCGSFVSDDIHISFDYGLHANEFYYWPRDTAFHETTVDGRDARIGIARVNFAPRVYPGFEYSTGITIRNVEQTPPLTAAEKAALDAWAKTPRTIRSPHLPVASRGPSNNLSLIASCRSERDVAIAHGIFKTLRFKEGEPKW